MDGDDVGLDSGQQLGEVFVAVEVEEQRRSAVLEGYQGLCIQYFGVARAQLFQGVGVGGSAALRGAL